MSFPRVLLLLIASLSMGVFAPSAQGQQIAVQQPIVSVSGVRTSVVVPDRGQMLLGRVASTESSRQQLGFWPRGSSVGRSLASRTSSVSVRIIDLREMDEAILAAANNSPATDDRRTVSFRETPAHPARTNLEEAERPERLACRAEERGQHGVAKLHRAAAERFLARP